MSSTPLSLVLTRLKLLTCAQSDAQLSRTLQISPQTLSSWKVRDSVPYALCVDIARTYACSLDWLLLGEGEPQRVPSTLDDWEARLLAQLRTLTLPDREAILMQVKDKQRLRQLEQQVQTLNEQLMAVSN
ncbi:helix-turn-helix domain-containing protein [Pseudomonas sp. RP23018S]|uniref:helix-turn-helix domain-containing protein n=1 Tax=Pseudomonas sp. RP23018S TaxID=3096037 RepID=UPI002AC9F6DB|nr:helix-turn-helix domain-containing protein [Pseudomonas sp. RP23018S]MDZ5602389.1 helix-turn-helix domain-containing protein [Pseudomonas sp. RP23018S]